MKKENKDTRKLLYCQLLRVGIVFIKLFKSFTCIKKNKPEQTTNAEQTISEEQTTTAEQTIPKEQTTTAEQPITKAEKNYFDNKFLQQNIGTNLSRTMCFQINFDTYIIACIHNLSDSVLILSLSKTKYHTK